QTVTDGEDGIDLGRIAERQPVLPYPDDEAANNIDHQDQQARHGVTAHEFTGTVHGTVELSFLADIFPPTSGFVFTDKTRIQISINGHLLAGHGIQGEACTDFGNPACTLGNHYKVNDDQNNEDD